MANERTNLYGPVPSRRLGLSLGVDIVPFKLCTLDCIYCQLGATTEKTLQRKDYVAVEDILAQMRGKIAGGLEADFVTIGGSGEPTLHCRLGEIVQSIKQITDIPVAILTNGTLLYRQDVRADCAGADVVLPSLDAGDEETFQRINRPHADISIEKVIRGLSCFRSEFSGQIWLEVLFLEGVNTSCEQIAKIREAVERIRPDKVQLNTAVRPTAQSGLEKLDPDSLRAIADQLGPNAEVVADFEPPHRPRHTSTGPAEVLSMLKRRPCSVEDVCSALGLSREQALRHIAELKQQGVVDSTDKEGATFFKAAGHPDRHGRRR
ncbi:MAG: radical SAM protein [Planctomycetota bacterium]|jgi:wyosine [tRNA(Phe)-imidazoG37] synthetase (radical SAM superfamily)